MVALHESSRPDRRYEALLVDYGGVLTTPVSASFAEFCLATGVSPERLRLVLARAYRGGSGDADDHPVDTREAGGLEDLVPAVETGRMPVEEFNVRLAVVLSEGLDQPVEAIDLTARLFGGAVSDERMIEVVRSARTQGIKTALISNTWGVRDPPPWHDEVFDAVVLSGQEGVRKPDPEIFHLTALRLGTDPAACVFVDDIAANAEGARSTGMTGVVHKHPDITIPRLEELFRISLT
jgi:epoxide hydrolase-like predicted phosphatase